METRKETLEINVPIKILVSQFISTFPYFFSFNSRIYVFPLYFPVVVCSTDYPLSKLSNFYFCSGFFRFLFIHCCIFVWRYNEIMTVFLVVLLLFVLLIHKTVKYLLFKWIKTAFCLVKKNVNPNKIGDEQQQTRAVPQMLLSRNFLWLGFCSAHLISLQNIKGV